jgi:hypothetical protein
MKEKDTHEFHSKRPEVFLSLSLSLQMSCGCAISSEYYFPSFEFENPEESRDIIVYLERKKNE